MSQDDIYSVPLENVGDFTFDERVVEVFPDMISRSVPGYASILTMIGELAERYATAGSQIYDLGCSLGAVSLLISQRVPPSCTIHAVDSSPAMIQRLREITQTLRPEHCEILLCEDEIQRISISDASFVVLNFTLQFIEAGFREGLLRTICDGTRPGGALVLSEKICFSDSTGGDLMTELHHGFKRANGYSDLEIAQKRSALENTLVPETLDVHVSRLQRAGYSIVVPWFQCFNFVSILAVK